MASSPMSKTKISVLLFLVCFINYASTAWATTPKKGKNITKPIVINKIMPKKLKLKANKTNTIAQTTRTKTGLRIANKTIKMPKTKTLAKTRTTRTISKTGGTVVPPPYEIRTTAPHTPQNIHTVIAQFEQKLLKTLRDKNIPGCAVAVVYKNQIVLMNGYGVRTQGKPEKIDADTVFQLGSVSKPIAATLTTVLENRGILNLNDPVSRYLPNFCLNGIKDREALKIKHVLNHTSGLPRAGFNHLIETFAPHTRIVRSLQTTHVSAAVGKRFDYHNAMFSLIGEITMAATKQSFQDVLTLQLLKPLNMNNTTATYTGLMRTANRASPHIRNAKGKLTVAPNYSTGYYAVAPAGGINSTIRDMSVFLKAQLGGYPALLDPAMLQRLQQPLIATPSTSLSAVNVARDKIKNSSYGLGWRMVDFNQRKLIYHGGWVKGFKNFIAFMPDHQVGIVILHNSETNGVANRLAMQFLDLFFSSR